MQISRLGQTLSFNWLLAIYLIVPLLLCVWTVDNFFFENSLLPYMGIESLLLPIYLLLFDLPHIIASLITFADKTYLSFYKTHIFFVIPAIVLTVVTSFYFFPTVTFLVYIFATMYHAIRQQTGIASMFARAKGNWFQVWSWSMILATAIVLALMKMPSFFGQQEINFSLIAVYVFVLISVISGILFSLKTNLVAGKKYIFVTTLMVATASFFAATGYFFFAVFVVRFVHDITAFAFYIVHDVNRNQDSFQNIFYSLFKKVNLPFILLVPMVSIVIASLLRIGLNEKELALIVVICLGFIHYYVESIMWKRDSIHRQYIAFSNPLN